MHFLTSPDHTISANGRHGKASDGGDHTAENNNHNSQTCNAQIQQLKIIVFQLQLTYALFLSGLS